MNGLSKWTNEAKKSTKKGGVTYIVSHPMLCDCGGSTPIGGDAGDIASFFYIDQEWICISCGRVLEPSIRDYEANADI